MSNAKVRYELTVMAKKIVGEWAEQAAERAKQSGSELAQSGNFAVSLMAKEDENAPPVVVSQAATDERLKGTIYKFVGPGEERPGVRREGPVNRTILGQAEEKKPTWENKKIMLRTEAVDSSHEFEARYILKEVLANVMGDVRRKSGDSILPKVDLKQGMLSLQFTSAAEGDRWLKAHKADIEKSIKPAMTALINVRTMGSFLKKGVADDRMPG